MSKTGVFLKFVCWDQKFLMFAVIFFLFCSREKLAAGQSPNEQFTYKRFTFEFDPGVNVKKINRKINLRKIPQFPGKEEKGLSSPDSRQQLGAKVNIIFNRVQNMLNMHPRKMKSLGFYAVKNQTALKPYFKKFGRGHTRAFYHIKENRIYFAADKVDEYVLAHEIAHAVIAHYYMVSTPPNVQEILAIHCDTHLKDAVVG